MNRLTKFSLALAASVFMAASAQANSYTTGDTLTLAYTSVSPKQVVSVKADTDGNNALNEASKSVYAGIMHFTISAPEKYKGIVDGLCIDPFQAAVASNQTYTVTPLASAPDRFALGMGADAATLIGKLWTLYFDAAKNDATGATAAGLQLAVWHIVGGNFVGGSFVQGTLFSTSSNLGKDMLTTAFGSDAKAANLVALTNGRYQDYVVEQVPDGGTTVLLLGLGLSGLALMRRRN